MPLTMSDPIWWGSCGMRNGRKFLLPVGHGHSLYSSYLPTSNLLYMVSTETPKIDFGSDVLFQEGQIAG